MTTYIFEADISAPRETRERRRFEFNQEQIAEILATLQLNTNGLNLNAEEFADVINERRQVSSLVALHHKRDAIDELLDAVGFRAWLDEMPSTVVEVEDLGPGKEGFMGQVSAEMR